MNKINEEQAYELCNNDGNLENILENFLELYGEEGPAKFEEYLSSCSSPKNSR